MPVTGQTITVTVLRSPVDEEDRRAGLELSERFSMFSQVLDKGVGDGVG